MDGKVGVCVFPDAGATTPPISAVSPSSGPVGGGTTVTLTGTGFQSGATVSFLDSARAVAAASVTFVSGTQLTAVTPASTLNFGAGQNRANFAIVGLATNGAGTVAVRNRAAADVHVVLDAGGHFQ